ncbi:hypothetical protein ACFQH6_19970 [Halobacteriaceae archaeon GCM10025711]
MSDLVADLADVDGDYRRAADAVEEMGDARLRRLQKAHGNVHDLLDRYEGRATGTGDFKAYIEFQDQVVSLVEDLPDDLPERDAFEQVSELFEKRRLSERDFDRARDLLAPAGDLAARLDDRARALERYRDARHAARKRVRALDDRIDDLEHLQTLGDADLEAPVEELRDPIEAYNDAAEDAFASFLDSAPAAEVLDYVAATDQFPLVPFRAPPADLRDYLVESEAGEEPVGTLLEYVDYSDSKRDHYVPDPERFRRRVVTNRRYLATLDAGPLTVDWPPPPANDLRWRVPELVSALDRIAADDAVEHLRTVRSLARDEAWYGRLRESALARDQLDDSQRERLASGEVAETLSELRDERERLERALDEYPGR